MCKALRCGEKGDMDSNYLAYFVLRVEEKRQRPFLIFSHPNHPSLTSQKPTNISVLYNQADDLREESRVPS